MKTENDGDSGEINLFDPKNFRKPQDPRLLRGPEQPLLGGFPVVIEARKPRKEEFVRVHSNPAYQAVLPLLVPGQPKKRREDNLYFLHPNLAIPSDLEHFVHDHLVAAAITSEGVPFLYTLKCSDTEWYDSGVEAMRQATDHWVHVIPHQAESRYVTVRAIAELGEPRFPDLPLSVYFERAFSKHVIDSLEHPVVRKLRGDF